MIAGGRVVADGSTAAIRAQASGRTVSAVVDPASIAWIRDTAPGVQDVSLRGDRIEIATDDSDATARFLFVHSDARDVEIVAHDLEDAFVALTSPATADKETVR